MAKKKKKAASSPAKVKRGSKLISPSFIGWEDWSGQKFNSFRRESQMFYYENYKPADLLPSVWEWMKQNGYTSAQIKQAKAAQSDINIPVSSMICCRLLLDGCPDLNPAHQEYWQSMPGCSGELQPLSTHSKQLVDKLVKQGKGKTAENKQQTKEVYQPTIQERIQEQVTEILGPVNQWLEELVTDPKSFKANGFDVKSHFAIKKVTQAHARKIINAYKLDSDDYQELVNFPSTARIGKMTDQEKDWIEQLREGYAHIGKADAKKAAKAYQNIIDACNMIIESAKATRKTRKPKIRSVTKLVEKLKFKKQDDKYSIVSINPADIIGANELWVFNIKTRKIGKYVATNIDPKGLGREGSGLSVKGTTIQGFDEELSVQKTLRKPEESLKQFKSAGKVALRRFLDDLTTTDTKLTGRVNADTVLLRIN